MNLKMKVTNGNFHQGQIVSNMAGFQCTAIALYALLTIFSIHPNLDPRVNRLHCYKWTSDVSPNNYRIKQPNAKISGTLGTTTICQS